MLRHPHLVRRFEDAYALAHPCDAAARRALFEALVGRARVVGTMPRCDPLAGLDHLIRLGRALNV